MLKVKDWEKAKYMETRRWQILVYIYVTSVLNYICAQAKDFKSEIVTKDRGGTAKKISSSRIIIVNLYIPNIKTPKCIKQIATETEVTDSSIIRG